MKLRLFHLRAILISVIASIHTVTHSDVSDDFYGLLFVSNTHRITNRCVFPRNAFNMCSCRNCSFQKLLIYIYFIYIYSFVNLFNEIIVEFLQIVILMQHAFLLSPFLFFPSLLFRLNETNF